MDAHRVAPKLYVGSTPPPKIAVYGFNVLVLCALEDQKPRDVLTLHAPLVDIEDPIDSESLRDAVKAAMIIHDFRQQGERVLVTCAAGVNRSAFVAALSLIRGGWTPQGAIERIRERRKPPVGMRPLSNREFVRVLCRLSRGPVPRPRGRA